MGLAGSVHLPPVRARRRPVEKVRLGGWLRCTDDKPMRRGAHALISSTHVGLRWPDAREMERQPSDDTLGRASQRESEFIALG